MNPLARMALIFSGLSFVSVGGFNALLPDIRRQVVEVNGWMSDADFQHLFAVASAAPGPNSIFISLIGFHVAGVIGLIVATLAILTPTCLLAFAVSRGLARWSESAWVARLNAALTPLSLGLILASGATMMRIADHRALAVLISAGAALYTAFSARNPLIALAAGCIASIVARHLGY